MHELLKRFAYSFNKHRMESTITLRQGAGDTEEHAITAPALQIGRRENDSLPQCHRLFLLSLPWKVSLHL